VDGDNLNYSKIGNPAHGIATVNANGAFSYTPEADFNGVDSFTFQASDGLLVSNVATVTVTVIAVNDAPVAADGAASGDEDAVSITGTASATDRARTRTRVPKATAR
jgi:VCBS repeat-containing protein